MSEPARWLAELTASSDVRAEAAAVALIEIGEPALDGLTELLESPSAEVRWWSLRTLSAIPHPRSSAALERALRDPDRMVRQAAALGLRLQPSPGGAEGLARLLSDSDPMVARLAAEALAELGSPSLDGLRRALASELPAARIQAARALALMKSRETVPDLFAALEDDSALVRHWAERGLEELGVGMAYYSSG